MHVIVFRCQNGIVMWYRHIGADSTVAWVCQRDGFGIVVPQSLAGVENFLQSVATHTIGIAGAVLQLVELEI